MNLLLMNLMFIPSPPFSGISLGPMRLHFYAVCILLGIVVAWWVSARRWRARGGKIESLEIIVMWAIPLGIVGARVYHVLTHIPDYFGPGRDPMTALFVWQGGLGIMGGIAFGAVGAWIGARQVKVPLATVADVLAPGLAFAQAIGRVGNYFNQELFGTPTTLPWGLEIDMAHRPAGYESFATFHPTFLYEMLWNVAVGFLLLWLDKRFVMGRGKLFFAYIALYTLGRLGTESLRIDPAPEILGFRNHQVITALLFLGAVAMLIWLFRYRPGPDPDLGAVPRRGATPDSVPARSVDSGHDSTDTDEFPFDDEDPKTKPGRSAVTPNEADADTLPGRSRLSMDSNDEDPT